MFAGRTANRSAINPQPAVRRNGRINKPTPPAISATPLIATQNSGKRKYRGMMRIYKSGHKK